MEDKWTERGCYCIGTRSTDTLFPYEETRHREVESEKESIPIGMTILLCRTNHLLVRIVVDENRALQKTFCGAKEIN